MLIEVTHFTSREERESEGISFFGGKRPDISPEVWTNDWFIIGDFYFHCKKEYEGDEDVQLVQHDSRTHEWISTMQDVRTVRYRYEGPELPWYRHERNVANLIFQDMYPDGRKLKGELVGALTKL